MQLFSTATREFANDLCPSEMLRPFSSCPCLTCSVKIVQVGITEVVFSQSYHMDAEVSNLGHLVSFFLLVTDYGQERKNISASRCPPQTVLPGTCYTLKSCQTWN